MATIKTIIFAPTKKEALAKFWEDMEKYGHGPDDLKIMSVAQKRNVKIGAVDLFEIYYRRRKE